MGTSATTVGTVGIGGVIATVLCFFLRPLFVRYYGTEPPAEVVMGLGTLITMFVAWLAPAHGVGRRKRSAPPVGE